MRTLGEGEGSDVQGTGEIIRAWKLWAKIDYHSSWHPNVASSSNYSSQSKISISLAESEREQVYIPGFINSLCGFPQHDCVLIIMLLLRQIDDTLSGDFSQEKWASRICLLFLISVSHNQREPYSLVKGEIPHGSLPRRGSSESPMDQMGNF